MVTIGDVFSVVAFLFGMAISAWALLIASAMVFSRKARISESLIRHAPGRSFAIGLFMFFSIGIVSLALLGLPLPLFKLMGWSGVLVILCFATLGGSGLILYIADRLRSYDAELRPMPALVRASLYVVFAGLVPLLGLFVIFPAVLAIGMGTGVQALFMRNEVGDVVGEYSV